MTAPATTNQRTTLKPSAALTLPNMPDTSPALQATLRQVLERLAVLDGQRGDDLDAAVTRRELVDAGIAKVERDQSMSATIRSVADASEWKNIPYLKAMPAPVAPTFKTGIGVNFLFWELPNARGVGATEVFRRTNDLDGAIIASPVGTMYADLPVEHNTTYHYKIRYVSELGMTGDWSPEVEVLSAVDPSYMVDVLNGQLNESSLAESLRERIKPDGVIDKAIEAEAAYRSTYYYDKTATGNAATLAANTALSKVVTTDADGNVVDLTAAVRSKVTTEADAATGKAIAKLSYQAQSGDKVAGFGLSNDGTVSEFAINADKFYLLQGTATPFSVANGVAYFNTAMIKDASISTAKIANLDATVANIAQANLYNAAIGGSIYSSNYNAAAKTGFSLNQDGSAFFGGNTTFAGKMEVRRVGSGAGVDITNDGIRVYDASGVLRVAIGKLV